MIEKDSARKEQMSKWQNRIFVLLAAVALVVTANEETAAETQPAPAEETPAPVVASARKPRSILQACRKELPLICKDRKDMMRCLASNADKVQDPVCQEWLSARTACNKFLKENNKCTAQQNSRICLRNIAKEELPTSCAESDYYKSVKLFGAFRRRTRMPKGESKSA
jgi:hypothetical protein